MRFLVVLICLALSRLVCIAQGGVSEYDMIAQSILKYQPDLEELEKDALFLTTRVGPKLTGTEGLKNASDYIMKHSLNIGAHKAYRSESSSLDYAWENTKRSLSIQKPYYQDINAIPVAWTSSTDGSIYAQIAFLKADNEDFLGNASISKDRLMTNKDYLKGKVLLMHQPVAFRADSSILLNRLTEEYFEIDRLNKSNLTISRLNGMIKSMAEKEAEFNLALQEVGVKAIIMPSRRNHGIIRGHGSFSGMFNEYEHPIPKLLVSSTDYNKLIKLSEMDHTEVELDISNNFIADAEISNTFVELEGIFKPEEIVMIGAHLDTWHLSDGATDNVAGVLILMGALKIIRDLNLELNRTVRFAFWSGEEQGLLGSANWVAKNQSALDNITAYLNVDTGTGMIRGVTSQLNKPAIPIFESVFEPLKPIGVMGVKHQYEVGSDYMPFNEAGVPAFHFKQDPIDYFQRTHHTHLDGYEYLRFDEIVNSSKVVAATIYYLANMKTKVPRYD